MADVFKSDYCKNLFCKDIHFIQSTLIYSFGLTRINHWFHGELGLYTDLSQIIKPVVLSVIQIAIKTVGSVVNKRFRFNHWVNGE
jgi:hypothetical protein